MGVGYKIMRSESVWELGIKPWDSKVHETQV